VTDALLLVGLLGLTVFGAVLVRFWIVLGKITVVVEALKVAIEGKESMLD